MLESKFQARLISRIKRTFDGCMVLKNDPNYIQGFPDLLILFPNGRWAALECKATEHSHRQPNQEHYVNVLSNMSFASFVYPENEEVVMDALQRSFQVPG